MLEPFHPDLGNLISVHQPKTIYLWLLPLLAFGPLMLLLLATVLMVDEIRQEAGKTLDSIWNYLPCLGLAGLLLVVLGCVWVSDFREWYATRTATLKIFEKGLIWENEGKPETCCWEDIKYIRYRTIRISSKYSIRWVKVIRSIATKTGKTIKLPETLDLERITVTIKEARKTFEKQPATLS